MATLNFTGIAGSLRKNSFNRALMHAAQELAPDDAAIEMLDIGKLPLFNQDMEADFPTEAQKMKDQIKTSDGIIISTPEYNRSIPGVLKNAVDWTSRPYGKSAWTGKPVYVIGVTPGVAVGTAIGQSHLKHSLLYLDARVLGQPEFYLSNASEKFDEDGKLIDQDTRTFLSEALQTFVEFCRQISD
jgi:chromate reductase